MRLFWRLGRRPSRAFAESPERPVGAKLEITYACNLRCGFCYTDSPRRTLQRTPELSDEQWRESCASRSSWASSRPLSPAASRCCAGS